MLVFCFLIEIDILTYHQSSVLFLHLLWVATPFPIIIMVIKFSKNGDASIPAAATATKKTKGKNNTRTKNINMKNTSKHHSKQSSTVSSSTVLSSSSTSTSTTSRYLPRQLRLMVMFIAIISFVSIWKSTDFTSSIQINQANEENMLLPTTITKLSNNLMLNLTTTTTQDKNTIIIENNNNNSGVIISEEESASSSSTTLNIATITNTNTTNRIVTAADTPPIMNNIQQPPQQRQQSTTTYTLKPPFQIIQVGNSRSGTTFQYNLLDAIISLKTPPNLPVPSDKNRGFVSGWSNDAFRIRVQHQTPFLLKFHASKQIFKDLQKETNENYTQWLLQNNNSSSSTTQQSEQEFHFGVFSSGLIGSSYSLYTQNFDSLINCSLCEINNYQPYFGLTTQDIITLKTHMHIYGIIRQCCGLQMSRYEIYRLNGCNITQFKSNPRYPNCEYYNLSNIEQRMIESPIPYKSNSPRWNWKKPGHCLYYRNKVQSEKLQFMGKPFEGCPNGTNPS